jgi:carbon monoxide dehydrogenase subunit G
MITSRSFASVRRRVAATFCAALLTAAVAAPAAAADSPIRVIDIAQNDQGYVATLQMYAPVQAGVAWDVLVDFDNMQKWVPNVRSSQITNRDGNTMNVEQKGVAKFGILSFPYTSVRRMELDPQKTIKATQVQGSMRRMMSLMKVTPDGNGTRLEYRLELEPAGVAATVLTKDFLKHELTEQFTAVVGEMVRRTTK